ncbi:hypothetical protein BDW60DRAFT_175873 [Aspergillus nidulans var. acristatus]
MRATIKHLKASERCTDFSYSAGAASRGVLGHLADSPWRPPRPLYASLKESTPECVSLGWPLSGGMKFSSALGIGFLSFVWRALALVF